MGHKPRARCNHGVDKAVTPLIITLFSDFTCPYSYVMDAALAKLADGEEVRIEHHPFELYPSPVELPPPGAAEGWEDATRALAHDLGMEIGQPDFRPRTRKAHEAAFFARTAGVGEQMRSAIFDAYWVKERDIGRVDVLMDLIAKLGMNPEDLKIALDIDTYADQVSAGRVLAERLNISSTPTIFIGKGPDAEIIVGARTAEELERTITEKRNQNG